MEALKTAIETFTTGQLQPLGIAFVILAIVVIGLCLIVGTRQMIDWAKNHIFHVIGGAVLIYLASDIATSFITTLGGF